MFKPGGSAKNGIIEMLRKLASVLIAVFLVFAMAKPSFALMCLDEIKEMLGGGHKKHMAQQAKAEEQVTDASGQTAQKEAANAGNEVCPVTGEKIGEKNKATYAYKGKIYNFCCSDCIAEFKAEPQKYIDRVDEGFHKGHRN